MSFKSKVALLLCTSMLIPTVCVNAEQPETETYYKRVQNTNNVFIVKDNKTDWSESGNMRTGSYHLEDENGTRLTEDYIWINPLSGSAGLYEYAIPAGHSDMWCGVFKLIDGQIRVLVEPETCSYRGIDTGDVSVYFPVFTEGEYYDADGNRINDLGEYLIEHDVSVTRDKWADEAIKCLIDRRCMPPCLAYNYKNNITRKEYCYLAMAAYDFKMGDYADDVYKKDIMSPFTDVDDYYVSTAAKLGIVSGTGNNKFEPDRSITRQEAAVLLCNLANIINSDANVEKVAEFEDDSMIASWAKPYVYKICGIKSQSGDGVMVGIGKNKFSPTTTYSRQQADVTIYRLLDDYIK